MFGPLQVHHPKRQKSTSNSSYQPVYCCKMLQTYKYILFANCLVAWCMLTICCDQQLLYAPNISILLRATKCAERAAKEIQGIPHATLVHLNAYVNMSCTINSILCCIQCNNAPKLTVFRNQGWSLTGRCHMQASGFSAPSPCMSSTVSTRLNCQPTECVSSNNAYGENGKNDYSTRMIWLLRKAVSLCASKSVCAETNSLSMLPTIPDRRPVISPRQTMEAADCEFTEVVCVCRGGVKLQMPVWKRLRPLNSSPKKSDWQTTNPWKLEVEDACAP